LNVLDQFKLDGKIALVTGIIGVSRSLESSGSGIEKQVLALGRKFTPYSADLAQRQAARAFAERVTADFPVIDILVNNAGTILRKPAADHPDGYWDEVLETNLSSPFILSREIGKRMVERGAGKIIFTASLLSFQGGITVPGYAASKGAIAQLTKALANEWAPCGVQVNAIAPGYVATDNTAALRADPVRTAAILSRIPAGRWGAPDDFKGAVVFLASPASDYVNGSILVVDGGWLAR